MEYQVANQQLREIQARLQEIANQLNELMITKQAVDEISKNVEREIKRLKAQVDLFWEKEIKHYVEYGLKDGMRILECGSGPGYLTEKLLREFPNSNVVALEIDPFLAAQSKNYLGEQGLSRFKVVQGSVLQQGFVENVFDFAITRLVIEHVADPVAAVREICRVLKLAQRVDYQIHCGSALGAFNKWVEGTEQAKWQNRHVDEIGEKLMHATANLLMQRFQALV